MTTREFSATKLPHPRYSLEVGRLFLNDDHQAKDLPKWIPKFSDKIQLIEVKRAGSALFNGSSGHDKGSNTISGEYIVIESVRPELFLRRDFISKFVDNGSVYISSQDVNAKQTIAPTTGAPSPGYCLFTSSENKLSLMLHEKVYRRFGLIGKKISSSGKRSKAKSRSSTYRVDIDLKDKRIKSSNSYQDKLVQTLRRLTHLDKIFFRYVPAQDSQTKSMGQPSPNDDATCNTAADEALSFFKFVIKEYELDGFKPVPLTNCYKVCRKFERKWTNYNQRHPKLSLSLRSSLKANIPFAGFGLMREVVELIDWLGYQMLNLDCDRDEISSNYLKETNNDKVDVYGSVISGPIDFEEFYTILKQKFAPESDSILDDVTLLRGFILYRKSLGSTNVSSDSKVIFLQDCRAESYGHEDLSNMITVVGVSVENDNY